MLPGLLVEFLGDRQRVPWLFIRALSGFGGLSFTYLALSSLDLGDATALFMTCPLYAAVLGACLLREPFLAHDALGLAIGIGGAILIARPGFLFGGSSLDLAGVAFALTAAISTAFVFISLRKLGPHGTLPTNFLVVSHHKCLHGAWLSLAGLWLSGQRFVWPSGLRLWGLLASLGVLEFMILSVLTFGAGREKASFAAAMRLWDVVFSFLWQRFLLHQAVPQTSVVGAGLVSSAMLFTMAMKWLRSRPMQRSYGKLQDSRAPHGVADVIGAREAKLKELEGQVSP